MKSDESSMQKELEELEDARNNDVQGAQNREARRDKTRDVALTQI
jgi:hypothetical protein